MKKLNIAILTGGNVAERGISLKSAKTVETHLDKNKYNTWMIELNGSQFIEQATGIVLDKNDFSLKKAGENTTFDLVYLILHGHPAEDGNIQGYFQLLGIPCTGCDHFVSALTFNKQATKNYLRNYDVPMATSRLIRRNDNIDWEALKALDFPVFVKPNKNGSSYGVSKVDEFSGVQKAVENAFQYDDEILVETFLDGKEFSNGVLRRDGEVVVLPITEIVPEGEFFDYQAKYENKSQEITPARLTNEEATKCKKLTKELYEILGCGGVCRMDYILVGDVFYFLEANTIPGFSEQSIVPQQAQAMGWTIGEVLDAVVAEVARLS